MGLVVDGFILEVRFTIKFRSEFPNKSMFRLFIARLLYPTDIRVLVVSWSVLGVPDHINELRSHVELGINSLCILSVRVGFSTLTLLVLLGFKLL